MRLPLTPTNNFLETISNFNPNSKTNNSNSPTLTFINEEPFIIELQGSLELPNGLNGGNLMDGVIVGKLILDEPNKPILQIAHHRLEGKLVTLTEPFALLRTTPASSSSTSLEISEPSPKRPRLSSPSTSTIPEVPPPPPPPVLKSSPEKMRTEEEEEDSIEKIPKIEIVGLVRRKIVFGKRPEPVAMSAMLSSEIDLPNEIDNDDDIVGRIEVEGVAEGQNRV